MNRLPREDLVRRYQLRDRLGPDLFKALLRASDIARLADIGDRKARRKLRSLRNWMGPVYWAALEVVLTNGSLSVGHRGDHEAIRNARNAVAMILDWEEEMALWGLA